jgi:hypothetical protein
VFDEITLWLVVVVAFSLGAGFTGVVFYLVCYRPLRLAAGACHQVLSGDLSHTVPEVGPAPLREMARVTNNMAADFQEILLLFAHLSRSALRSGQLLQVHVAKEGASEADRRHAAEIVEDACEMQEMIQDFKYFRVRFDHGCIIDSGLPHAAPRDDAAPTLSLKEKSHEFPGTLIHSPDPF